MPIRYINSADILFRAECMLSDRQLVMWAYNGGLTRWPDSTEGRVEHARRHWREDAARLIWC